MNLIGNRHFLSAPASSRFRGWLAMVCLIILPGMPALADQPIDNSVRDAAEVQATADARDVEEVRAAPDAETEQLLKEADALRTRLEEFGYQLGVYDPALMEVQSDLARTLLSLEQYEEAAAVLTEALQLARVTDGLYGDRQLAILDDLSAAHKALQDWERVDDYQHLRFELLARKHAPDSAGYADALIERAAWQLQASQYSLLGRPGSQHAVQQLMDMNEEYQLALDSARQRGDARQQWELLSAVAMTDTEIARHINYQGLTDSFSSTPRYITQTICRMVPDGAGGAQRVCWQERVANPDYYFSAVSQRRTQLERARLNLQATRREMELFLLQNPGFASEHVEETGHRLASIERIVADLQREARRSTLRQW